MSWSERVSQYRTLLSSGGVSIHENNMLAVIATTSLVVLGLTWLILDFPRVSNLCPHFEPLTSPHLASPHL